MSIAQYAVMALHSKTQYFILSKLAPTSNILLNCDFAVNRKKRYSLIKLENNKRL